MKIKVDWDTSEAERIFRKEVLIRGIRGGNTEIARLLLAALRANAPVVTGLLRGSFHSKMPEDLVVEWLCIYYGIYVEARSGFAEQAVRDNLRDMGEALIDGILKEVERAR